MKLIKSFEEYLTCVNVTEEIDKSTVYDGAKEKDAWEALQLAEQEHCRNMTETEGEVGKYKRLALKNQEEYRKLLEEKENTEKKHGLFMDGVDEYLDRIESGLESIQSMQEFVRIQDAKRKV